MWEIVLDTSLERCGAGLLNRKTNAYDEISQEMKAGHAEHLVPMLEQLMTRNDATFSELNRVCVISGPGSFTGVRVAVAAAKAIALASSCKIVDMNHLQAVALGLAETGTKTICSVISAKHGNVYACVMQNQDQILEPKCLPWIELLEILGAREHCVMVGPGVSEFRQCQENSPNIETIYLPHCDLQKVALFVFEKDLSNDRPIKPFYLRAPSIHNQRAVS